jgi:RNA polymerase sigma-70 factor (ECF subfamily)
MAGPEMAEPGAEEALVARAVAGETFALEQLLLYHHDRLARHVAGQLPDDLRPGADVEDVLQQTYMQVFRDIRRFQPRGEGSFFRWLATVAQNRLLDAIKARRAAKRGAGQRAAAPAGDREGSSAEDWADLAAGREPTPSQVVARAEARQAVLVALAGLKPAYREALRLHHLEGKPVAEVAALMGRTEGAVQMLCQRGLEKLREALGRASLYLSRD